MLIYSNGQKLKSSKSQKLKNSKKGSKAPMFKSSIAKKPKAQKLRYLEFELLE